MKQSLLVFMALAVICFTGCGETNPSSDQIDRTNQEKILKEANSTVGLPAIKNFREKRILKEILELRDQDGLTTYVYLFAENTGKLIFMGEAIGYPMPYSTQFTNPQKDEWRGTSGGAGHYTTLPQADPNALFSPASAEGTWVMLLDKHTGKARPVYFEPRIVVSPFKLDIP